MVDPDKVDIVFKEAFARLAPDFDPLETHFDNFMAAHKAAFAEAVEYINGEILADWGMIPNPKNPTPRTDAFAKPMHRDLDYSRLLDHARVMEHELAAALRVIAEISRRTTFYEIDIFMVDISAGSIAARSAAGPSLLATIGKIITENS